MRGEWKKQKLREHGAIVVEYAEDYGVAVEQGRKEAERDPNCFFIDDEHSRTLFLGYAVAGERVKKQFDEMGIRVDADHPLFVYLPCGVGGGPGGVAFGLKLAFGDNVHCFFAEPTHPACCSGPHRVARCHCGARPWHRQPHRRRRPRGGTRLRFCRPRHGTPACGLLHPERSGDVRPAGAPARDEEIRLEPSALAGMAGPWRVATNLEWQSGQGLDAAKMAGATHLVWATGGGMVPAEEMENTWPAPGSDLFRPVTRRPGGFFCCEISKMAPQSSPP
jgi:D-serine dehydratase